MSTLATTLYDEEVLHGDEVPDAALELAGSKLWEGPAASFTLSFCSGLDTCPTSPRNKEGGGQANNSAPFIHQQDAKRLPARAR